LDSGKCGQKPGDCNGEIELCSGSSEAMLQHFGCQIVSHTLRALREYLKYVLWTAGHNREYLVEPSILNAFGEQIAVSADENPARTFPTKGLKQPFGIEAKLAVPDRTGFRLDCQART
jgi:hypothetical protein